MALPAYIDESTGAITDGEAWVALATKTPSGANVSFTSTDDGQVGDWSQYMDLVVIGYFRMSASGTYGGMWLNFNSDTGSNYAWQEMVCDGSSVNSWATGSAGSAGTDYIRVAHCPKAGATANIFGSMVLNIFDVNSGKHKLLTSTSAADLDSNNTDSTCVLFTGTWKKQDPITSITFDVDNNYVTGTRFDLFGVLPRMVA